MPSNRPAVRRPRLAAAMLAIAAAPLFVPAIASAQQVMTMSVSAPRGMFGGGSRPAMHQRELEDYAAILGFDDDQRDVAKELLSAYTAEYEKASKEQAEGMRRIAEEFRETRDDDVWQDMGPLQEKFSRRSKELEATLLNDLKSLCTEEQLAHWPKMERTRRRDQTIDRGSMAGESIDLVRIVKGLKLPADSGAELAPQLESYEQDLDRALVARNKIIDEQAAAFTPGQRGFSIDFEKMQEQARDMREAGVKVRDVNQRYARAIEGMLPESLRAEFAQQVKRATFPMVYRQSRAERAFEAALKFDDLDAKQRDAITALRDSYAQEASALNDRWAAALKDEEESGDGALSVGGAVLVMRAGDEEKETPADAARKARRNADKKAVESLESLLSEQQRERLPKGGDEPGPGGAMSVERRVIGAP